MASILPVFVPHEGCPCRCVFCNQNAIAGQTAGMTAERARKILCEGLSRLPEGSRPQAAFYGGSFTAIAETQQEALLAVTDEMIAQGHLSDVRISTRPDAITPEILARLRRHRVTTVELGAQSMDETVLLRSGRGHTAQDTRRAAGLVQEAGLSLILQTMVGLPGDTRGTVRRTAQEIASLQPDGVRIYPVVVLPDTVLYEQYRCGEYHALEPDEAAEWCADMLEVFLPAHIPVIRVGLNPSEDLHAQAVAGAYHPAMGELAYNALWYRRLRAQLEAGAGDILTVPARELSRAIGQKRRNLLRLREEFPDRNIQIKAK
ncbi:MAG: radical SAM protein [Eubacteriales bacterium]|nr:radical SAM protein [Eubacteriales bacterium]